MLTTKPTQLRYQRVNNPLKISLQTSVLAGLCAVCHMSHADSLEIYGLGHVSGNLLESEGDQVATFSSNSSRLGVRGEYLLGFGPKLVYQLETGLDLTFQGENNDGNGGNNDGGKLFSKTRPSFIGLETRYGQLSYGHKDVLDQWANEFNLFADQVGDIGNLWAGSGLPGRMDDVIEFRSPSNMPGYVNWAYRPKSGANRDAMFMRSGYRLDRLALSLTYGEFEPGAYTPVEELQPDQTENHVIQAAVLRYTTDRAGLGGGVQRELDIRGRAGEHRTSYTFGAYRQLSPEIRLRAQYTRSLGSGPDADASLWGAGVDWNIRDNTTLYVSVAGVENDANASFTVDGKGKGKPQMLLPGEDATVMSLGVVVRMDSVLFE